MSAKEEEDSANPATGQSDEHPAFADGDSEARAQNDEGPCDSKPLSAPSKDSDLHRTMKGAHNQVGGYAKIIVFTCNIILGLATSQVVAGTMPRHVYDVWYEVVRLLTLWCLSFIMVNVGYEFTFDKSRLMSSGVDFIIAMGAAGIPWLLVAAYFIWALPDPLPWNEGLLAARFAAPTSAGILFCMLEAASLKETWLFKKARVLAIFDDLDTILLMVPLKALIMGVKWELFVVLAAVVILLVLAYKRLHEYRLPQGYRWTMLYAFLVTAATELVYFVTKKHIEMEAVHLEVLLPAFVIGAVIRAPDLDAGVAASAVDKAGTADTAAELEAARAAAGARLKEQKAADERASTVVSAIFMVFVGLSMPSLFGDGVAAEDEAPLDPGSLMAHVAAVSIIMVVGKMFLVGCYRREADLRTRIALGLGMCPRGEVGAGVIVISLNLGVKGVGAAISIICLALNITMSGLYILAVKKLLTKPVADSSGERVLIIERRSTHIFGQMELTEDGTISV